MTQLKSFMYEEEGMGTIEIAIIVAALVALAIAFKGQLKTLWTSIKGSITNQSAAASDTSGF